MSVGGGVLGSIPILGGLVGQIVDTAQENQDLGNYQDALNQINGVQDPRFSGQQYQAINYDPTMYQTPESAQYQTISEDPSIRNYQISALQNMQNLANGSADAGYAAQAYQAMNSANQDAAAREGAIRANMAARGLGGSGLEMVSRNQAAQDAANRAQSGGLSAAQAAALMRMQGNTNALNAASGIRGQDFNTNSANSDIINRFNMYNTGMRNQVNQANTNLANQAALYNSQNQQNVQQQNINRGDRNAQQLYSDQLGRSSAYAGGTGNLTSMQLGQMNQDRQQGNQNRQELSKLMAGGMGGGGGGMGGGGMGMGDFEDGMGGMA